jgi:hypothetical protein
LRPSTVNKSRGGLGDGHNTSKATASGVALQSADRHHRRPNRCGHHGAGTRQQPNIHSPRPLIERPGGISLSVNLRPQGARLLPLHALTWIAKLAQPRQQRKLSCQHKADRRDQPPVPWGMGRMPPPTPDWPPAAVPFTPSTPAESPMNPSTRVLPRRGPWPFTARAVLVVSAVAGVALLASGCGSSTGRQVAQLAPATTRPHGSSKAKTSTNPSLIAYAGCMRQHGVPSFPDPTSGGVIVKPSQQELNSPRFETAERGCQRLLPAGTDDQFPPGEVGQLLIGMLRFSRCMRSHGVPNWPDPTTDSQNRPEFPLEGIPGTSRSYWHSPRIDRVGNECQQLLPPALGGTPVG